MLLRPGIDLLSAQGLLWEILFHFQYRDDADELRGGKDISSGPPRCSGDKTTSPGRQSYEIEEFFSPLKEAEKKKRKKAEGKIHHNSLPTPMRTLKKKKPEPHSSPWCLVEG